MKFPKISQLRFFFYVLSKKEKFLFFLFFFLFLISGSYLFFHFYFETTEKVPTEGGKFVEGALGKITFLNPLYSFFSPQEEAISDLLFCSLFSSNLKGEIIPDVAEDYQILEEGKVFEVTLKKNIFWSDGKKLEPEDVIFTLRLIQNPNTQSPLRKIYLNVDVEKVGERKLKFTLKEGNALFLEQLQFKILPRHILEKLTPKEIFISEFNQKPIGCGKYKIKKIKKNKAGEIKEILLERNKYYFGKKPYLKDISFLFFENEKELERKIKKGEIDGFLVNNLKKLGNFSSISFSFPKFYALFFNLKQEILKEKEIREAIFLLINKKELFPENFKGKLISSPILAQFYQEKEIPDFPFDPKKAKEKIENLGYKISEDGIYQKEIKKEPFKFKRDLKLGDKGEEVKKLQECLGIEVTGIFGNKTKEKVIEFQEKYKKEILEPQGKEKGTGEVREATRRKLNELCFREEEKKISLNFSLVIIDDEEILKVAEKIKDQLKKGGINIEIRKFELATLEREILPKRNYDLLLIGQNLGLLQNLFPFWHSSQNVEYGMNLCAFENENLDSLLEKYKKEIQEQKRKEIAQNIQEILGEEKVVFPIFSPEIEYFVSKKIKGVKGGKISNLGKRFLEIEDWYQKEKRVWKKKF